MVTYGKNRFYYIPIKSSNCIQPCWAAFGKVQTLDYWTDILLVLTQLSLAKVAAGDSQLNTRWLK